MERALTILAAVSVAILGTAALFLANKTPTYVAMLIFVVALALVSRRLRYPLWLVALTFGFMGAAHLIALWMLRYRAETAGAAPALETFGYGDLLISAVYFVRGHWSKRAHP
jgi:hypothetical protein